MLIACGLPILWLLAQLALRPHLWTDAVPDAFRWRLIARTFGFNAIAATLAVLFALPIAVGLAFSRRGRWLWWVVPLPLLVPSLVVTYGWKQAAGLLGADPLPQSIGDVARCILALASWLWPAPAMVIATAFSRVDADLLMHARLDGAVARVLARTMAAPAAIGWLAAMLLALQEFAVFEPTGISVIATETRFVFETGSSIDQSWSMLPADAMSVSQEARMGAVLAVMLPALLLTIGIVLGVGRAIRSLHAGDDAWGVGAADAVRAPPWVAAVGYIEVSLLMGVPIVSMIATHQGRADPLGIFVAYRPQLLGSLGLASCAAIVGAIIVLLGSVDRILRPLVALALASFLIGGQWSAIALIVLFNRPELVWLYDSIALPIIAYTGRFAWIALAAAALTGAGGLRPLREMAAVDGAGSWLTWRRVIVPITWPLLVGAVLLIFTLSLTEVPATTLLQPANTLVPMLMTWAHSLNYDAMIDASLLLVTIVATIGVAVVGLVRLAAGMTKTR